MLKKIDYRILLELDKDARQSYSQIAESIGTSKQVIAYHINTLAQEGYIRKFLTIFDLSKLGFILHKVYLRLIRISIEEELQLVDFLKKHKNVAWLVRTEGIYDLAFALHTIDILELNALLLDMENKYGRVISEKIVNRVLTGEFFPRDYLLEKETTTADHKAIIFQTTDAQKPLDGIDWKIIAALARDGRKTVVDMAKRISLTADAISKRIRRLEKEKVIRNYILVVDDAKLNQLHYKILLKITNFNETIEKKLLQFCRQHPNITFYNRNIGFWDIEMDMEVKKAEDFREIMRTIKTAFADNIKEYFSLMIYDIQKFDFVPMYEF